MGSCFMGFMGSWLIRGFPSLVKVREPSSAFSKGLLGNMGLPDKPFFTGVMVAMGTMLGLVFFILEMAGVRVTEGAIKVELLETFDKETEGVEETTFDFGLPVAGVRVQDPMVFMSELKLLLALPWEELLIKESAQELLMSAMLAVSNMGFCDNLDPMGAWDGKRPGIVGVSEIEGGKAGMGLELGFLLVI